MPRRSHISLKRSAGLTMRRQIVKNDKVVYVLVVNRPLKYEQGRSSIGYIGTTRNGAFRIAYSAAVRANDLLRNYRGVSSLKARLVTCRRRQRVKMWLKLERAMLLVFRETFGGPPKCNTHGKHIVESDEFRYFRRDRIKQFINQLSKG
jgi:hypothetical protein